MPDIFETADAFLLTFKLHVTNAFVVPFGDKDVEVTVSQDVLPVVSVPKGVWVSPRLLELREDTELDSENTEVLASEGTASRNERRGLNVQYLSVDDMNSNVLRDARAAPAHVSFPDSVRRAPEGSLVHDLFCEGPTLPPQVAASEAPTKDSSGITQGVAHATLRRSKMFDAEGKQKARAVVNKTVVFSTTIGGDQRLYAPRAHTTDTKRDGSMISVSVESFAGDNACVRCVLSCVLLTMYILLSL